MTASTEAAVLPITVAAVLMEAAVLTVVLSAWTIVQIHAFRGFEHCNCHTNACITVAAQAIVVKHSVLLSFQGVQMLVSRWLLRLKKAQAVM